MRSDCDSTGDRNTDTTTITDTAIPINVQSRVIDSYAQFDAGGRMFVSLPSDLDVDATPEYGVFLSSGDPAAVTGLVGDNPRFHGIYLV